MKNTSKSKPPPKKSLEAQIAAKGLRLTPSRRIIAQVLEKSSDHPDVAEIYDRAIRLDQKISIPTVYRTLKRFHEIGVLERHDFDPEAIKTGTNKTGAKGRWRYESMDKQEHYHLIDIKTGRIIEFENPELDKLQNAIALKLGYNLHSQKIELYGTLIKKSQKQNV